MGLRRLRRRRFLVGASPVVSEGFTAWASGLRGARSSGEAGAESLVASSAVVSGAAPSALEFDPERLRRRRLRLRGGPEPSGEASPCARGSLAGPLFSAGSRDESCGGSFRLESGGSA
ncbi:MAG: hypothetical protein AAF288_09595 [Planctomycetota bacterium]